MAIIPVEHAMIAGPARTMVESSDGAAAVEQSCGLLADKVHDEVALKDLAARAAVVDCRTRRTTERDPSEDRGAGG